MTFPKWMKPGTYGAVVGAIVVSLLGFNWGGWTTESNAESQAQARAAQEVTLAMVPICLDISATDPERAAKLTTLQDVTVFNRNKAMMATGWATPPGFDAPSRDLAVACIEGLELDGS